MKKIKTLAVAAVTVLAASVPVQANAANKICVFDILGAQGDAYGLMKDYALAATKMGAAVELKAYTDERTAAEDFKAGQCDGVLLTGLRGRQFNKFTGSLDSIGAIPSYAVMEKAIATLANPALAPRMVEGKFEVAGVAPAGAAYLFVKSRSINHVDKLAGKKIAIFDYDVFNIFMLFDVRIRKTIAIITQHDIRLIHNIMRVVYWFAVARRRCRRCFGLIRFHVS